MNGIPVSRLAANTDRRAPKIGRGARGRDPGGCEGRNGFYSSKIVSNWMSRGPAMF